MVTAFSSASAVFIWYWSTAYSHCFFVIPIAAYLAWDRRHLLASVPIEPLPWAALLALPLEEARRSLIPRISINGALHKIP